MGWCVCMYVSVWDFVCAREALKEWRRVQCDAFLTKCMSETINMLVNENHHSMNLINHLATVQELLAPDP